MDLRIPHARLTRWVVLWATCLCAAAHSQLRIEAETVVVNRDALGENIRPERKWNIWSTDTDRFEKWSKGVVIQGPVVKADRESPEAGAPPLHLRLADLPAGTYTVELRTGRVLGLSLDGVRWKRYTGGVIATGVRFPGKAFEFWIDDRFAMPKPEECGSAYLDFISLHPVAGIEAGVDNGDFETVADGNRAAGWTWWSREGKGEAVSVDTDSHGGKRAVRIAHDGKRDWAFTCGTRMTVAPDTDLCVTAWAKGPKGGQPIGVHVVGCYNGERVTWKLGGGRGTMDGKWKELKGCFTVPEGINEIYVRFVGQGNTQVWLDDVAVKAGKMVFPRKPKVKGWARERVAEPMGRGVVALPRGDGGIYVGWRLLRDDPPGIGFDVFRQAGAGPTSKLNARPVVQTTDFVDPSPPRTSELLYIVRPAGNARAPEGRSAPVPLPEEGSPHLTIRLEEPDTVFQKVAVADLNGDGVYDYVIKQPGANIDPWVKYWYKSPETYKLEAYLADGTFLWRIDLGWGIERGVWYSPYLACDLTGDGKAEVAAKMGEGDPRDEDGRVASGPEWLVVWDGMTGQEIARVPWPAREDFSSYNLASRNQIAVAYLDGKTPCLLALRGTYARMKVDAYQLRDGKLETVWRYDNEPYGGRYWGQGAHFTLAADVDGDGRDEVLLGSAALDDNGVPLWTTGRGHPDAAYLSDVDPARPGMEMAYGVETRQPGGGGLNLVSAATGKTLWKLDTPTRHVHSKGMCADIDPLIPGMEIYGADADGHKLTSKRWLFAADGSLLRSGADCPWGFAIRTAWWDGDLQKEFSGTRFSDYGGGPVQGRTEGAVRITADVVGDWREELITSVKGELRIYSTTIPAMDRRVCLMQDPVYRSGTTMNSMGYTQDPTLSYNPEVRSPNLNLTFVERKDAAPVCRVVISAPRTSGLEGVFESRPPAGVKLEPSSFPVRLGPGERLARELALQTVSEEPWRGMLTATLTTSAGIPLRGQVTVRLGGRFLRAGNRVQAENIWKETNGTVRIRDDKPGVMGKAISHWDDPGHTLSWRIRVPEAGVYRLVLRYSTPGRVTRNLTLDGNDRGPFTLPGTGGFGASASEWEHATVKAKGAPDGFQLAAGEHTITLRNTDGQGCNLDYLVLVRQP